MNYKKENYLHIIDFILFIVVIILSFIPPNIYGHILFQLFFWLTLSNFFRYLLKIFKQTKQNNLSFLHVGQLIFYLSLIFIIQYYLLLPYNETYTIDSFFFVSGILFFGITFIFLLMFNIYNRFIKRIIK